MIVMIIIWKNLLCSCGLEMQVAEASSAFGPETSCIYGEAKCL